MRTENILGKKYPSITMKKKIFFEIKETKKKGSNDTNEKFRLT